MRYHASKLNIYPTLALTALLITAPAVFAGANDFFGQTLPNGQSVQDTDGKNLAPAVGAPLGAPTGGDYTDDEKRMQKKYRSNIAHARSLIAKGEKMMKDTKDDKTYKKGKILKEIGEKRLQELKTNNPFADDLDRDAKGKSDSKKAEL